MPDGVAAAPVPEPAPLSSAASRRGWPAALAVGESGALCFDGVDLAALARERGTPLWAISRATVEANWHALDDALRARWPRHEIAYSMKTNNVLALVALLHGLGARLDCSGAYELEAAARAGVPSSDVILNGAGKSDEALALAARLGVRQVNIDSPDEARRLDRLAGEAGTRVPCTVRVVLGHQRLLARDPSYASSQRAADKHGSDRLSGQALEAIEAVVRSRNLDFVGLHHHVVFPGYLSDYAPERALAQHGESARELCEVANEARRRFGVSIDRLDLGGGLRAGGEALVAPLGAPEQAGWHRLPTATAFADAVCGAIEEFIEQDELPLVQFESGANMVWNAQVLLAAVSEVKDAARRDEPRRRYAYLDASAMMFMSRGMRMGHPAVPVARPLAAADPEWPVELVGQTCMGDTVADGLALPRLEPGEVVALLHQGAYCEALSTQVNSIPRPEVVLLDRGAVSVVRRRETLDDVHARDAVPAGLGRTAGAAAAAPA